MKKILLMFLLVASIGFAQQWQDSDYMSRIIVNVTDNADRNLDNYPLLINLSYQTGMEADFTDLVTYYWNQTGDGTQTQIPLSFESFVASNYVDLVVNQTDVPASGTSKFIIYFNNSGATTQSNINETYSFFEDVEHPVQISQGGKWVGGIPQNPYRDGSTFVHGNFSLGLNQTGAANSNVINSTDFTVNDQLGYNFSGFVRCSTDSNAQPCTYSFYKTTPFDGTTLAFQIEQATNFRVFNISSSSNVDTGIAHAVDTWEYVEFYCNQTGGSTIIIEGNIITGNFDYCNTGLVRAVPSNSGVGTISLMDYWKVRKQVTPEPTVALNPVENIVQSDVDVTIIQPENTTYSVLNTSIPTDWSVIGSDPTYTCSEFIDGSENVLGSIPNNTIQSDNITTLDSGDHNYTIQCQNPTTLTIDAASVLFTIGSPSIVDCSVGGSVVAANITLKGEISRQQIFGDMDISVLYRATLTGNTSTYAATKINTTSENICLDQSGQLIGDIIIQYDNATSPEREYYVVNTILDTSNVMSISPHLLNDANSTTAKISVKSKAGLAQSGLYVQIFRLYNLTTYVQLTGVLTGTDGTDLVNLVDKDSGTNVFYRMIVQNSNGNNITTAFFSKLTTDSLTGLIEVTINLEDPLGQAFDLYGKVGAVCLNLTNTIQCTYSDSSGLLNNIVITAQNKPYGSFVFTDVCTNSSTAKSGTLICYIGNTPNGTYTYTVTATLSNTNIPVKSGSFDYLLIQGLGIVGLLITALLVVSGGFIGSQTGGGTGMVIGTLILLDASAAMLLFVVPLEILLLINFSGLVIAGVLRD